MNMTLQQLEELLVDCYSKDLCYPKVQEKWNSNNKQWGMCAITALVVDDFFDTEFGKIIVDGVSHYFNVKNGEIIDLTAAQFGKNLNYENYEHIERDKIISNQNTKKRYEKLKNRILARKSV